MSHVIYALCALTSIACAILLLRSYRRTQARLLFWSGLCFVALSVNNVLLVFDMFDLVDDALDMPRLLAALAAVGFMLYGLILAED
jgi:hypothetical protein